MSSNFIPPSLQHLWRTWNIRGFMLLSLYLQTILALTAPLRQRTNKKVVILLVWSAFILADWATIFAFGLISNTQRGDTLVVNNNIMAFWSTFLLIHLGGTDSITAFSLEDNALWLRHLVGLAVQVAVFLYIFLKTLPDNNLVLPTVFVFIAGVNKYAERTRALYLASLENLKKSIFQSSSDIPESEEVSESSGEQVIAEIFFRVFKGLIVDISPTYAQRSWSRNFFMRRTAEQTYNLISLELGLMYAVFYTKFLAVSSRWGMFTRTMGFGSGITALVLFSRSDKADVDKVDIGVSYALLVGVILLDMDSALVLFQVEWVNPAYWDWGVCAKLQKLFLSLLAFVIFMMEIPLCFCGLGPVFEQPWSKTIATFNLLDYCLKESRRSSEGGKLRQAWNSFSDFVGENFGLKDLIDQLRYKSQTGFDAELWEYIFKELRDKASSIDDPGKAKEFSEARGESTLEKHRLEELAQYVTDIEYDEEILMWHVATEICYQIDEVESHEHGMKMSSKVLSDYMLYLLVMQQKKTSAIADMGPIRFRDSCLQARAVWKISKAKDVKELCEKLLEETTSLVYSHDVEERGNSVLRDACKLARILRRKDRKWEVICSVWVEILSYAANHCRPDSHARMVCEGGELVSFVWLLMAHFGMGTRFPKYKETRRFLSSRVLVI